MNFPILAVIGCAAVVTAYVVSTNSRLRAERRRLSSRPGEPDEAFLMIMKLTPGSFPADIALAVRQCAGKISGVQAESIHGLDRLNKELRSLRMFGEFYSTSEFVSELENKLNVRIPAKIASSILDPEELPDETTFADFAWLVVDILCKGTIRLEG